MEVSNKKDIEKGDNEESEALLDSSERRQSIIQARRLSKGNVGRSNLSSLLRMNSVEANEELANTIFPNQDLTRRKSIFQTPPESVKPPLTNKWRKIALSKGSTLALVSEIQETQKTEEIERKKI